MYTHMYLHTCMYIHACIYITFWLPACYFMIMTRRYLECRRLKRWVRCGENVFMHAFTYVCICGICTSVLACIFIHVCGCAWHVYVYIHVCLHAYIHVCVHIRACMQTFTHAYIHTLNILAADLLFYDYGLALFRMKTIKACMNVCINSYMRTHNITCMHRHCLENRQHTLYMHVYMRACIRTHIDVYACMHACTGIF